MFEALDADIKSCSKPQGYAYPNSAGALNYPARTCLPNRGIRPMMETCCGTLQPVFRWLAEMKGSQERSNEGAKGVWIRCVLVFFCAGVFLGWSVSVLDVLVFFVCWCFVLCFCLLVILSAGVFLWLGVFLCWCFYGLVFCGQTFLRCLCFVCWFFLCHPYLYIICLFLSPSRSVDLDLSPLRRQQKKKTRRF